MSPPSRLLERDAFLAALGEYAAEARDGRGRMVFVGGEAGVGKTALLEAFRGQVGDATWLWGACDGLFTPRPLGPVFDVARQTGGPLAAACAAGVREDIFDATRAALDVPGQLTILAVEDIHWADEATLDLLRYLTRRIVDSRALVLVTFRDEAIGLDSGLQALLGDVATQRTARRISLPVLSLMGVSVLAHDTGFEPARLRQLTGGNPFFLTEVLGGAVDTVPTSARDAVMARVARLTPAARSALQAAALIGSQVEIWLLRDALAATPAAIDECVTSGLLTTDDRALTLGFRHEIARVAIELSVPAQQANDMNRSILAALLAKGGLDHARLAHHAEAAGDAAQVIEHAPAAAQEAAGFGSHREAAARYSQVLRFSDHLHTRAAAEMYDALATELALIDRLEEAVAAREQGLNRWRSVGDRLRIGNDLQSMSVPLWRLCRGTEARAASAAALIELQSLPPSRELAWAYEIASHDKLNEGDRAVALALQDQGKRLAAELGLAELTCRCATTESWMAFEHGEAWCPAALAALHTARDESFDVQAGRTYSNLQTMLTYSRQLDEAERNFSEGIAFCDARDLATWSALMHAWRTRGLVHRGQFDAAAALCQELLDSPDTAPINRIAPLTSLGLILGRRGDMTRARAALDEALTNAVSSGEAHYVHGIHLARAEALWLDNRDDIAAELAGAAAVTQLRNPWFVGALAVWQHRVGIVPTPEAELAPPYQLELDGKYAEAAAAWDDLSCPYDAGLALLGADDETLLRAALDRMTSLGATAAAAIARRRLQVLGVATVPTGPRRSTSSHPLGLTEREQDVLALLCDDLGNAEIAARLVISQRTVDHHVSSILRKLDVTSRSAAAAKARDLAPINP